MGMGAAPMMPVRSTVGMPKSTHKASLAWRIAACKGGIWASVDSWMASCLVEVEFGFEAGLHSPARVLHNAFLDFHIGAEILDLLLVGADGQIVFGEIAEQGDQGGVVAGDVGLQESLLRLHGAAELAPEIQLPLQVEIRGPIIEMGTAALRWGGSR